MTRRRKLLAGTLSLLLVAAAAASVFWLVVPVPGVSVDNAYRIRNQMAKAEVEAILGGPPSRWVSLGWWDEGFWDTADLVIFIQFYKGPESRVSYVQYCVNPSKDSPWQPVVFDDPWLDRLKRRLHIGS